MLVIPSIVVVLPPACSKNQRGTVSLIPVEKGIHNARAVKKLTP
jgi:hypothetical protein